jgi:hypothetical protein
MTDGSHDRALLVDRLFELTSCSQAAWEEDTPEGRVLLRLGTWGVILNPSDARGLSGVSIIVREASGKDIDRFDCDDLSAWRPDEPTFDDYFEKMEALYRAARRATTDADRAIAAILSLLPEAAAEPQKQVEALPVAEEAPSSSPWSDFDLTKDWSPSGSS